MEHKVIRYQAFQHRPGYDLACSCGARWYLEPEKRAFGRLLSGVALHFKWDPPAITANSGELKAWLWEHLPENIRGAQP